VNRLANLQRWFLYATLALLAGSGLLWAAFHYLLATRQAAAIEAEAMKVHGGVAMLALLALGSLLPGHVAKGWRVGNKKRTGAAMLASCAVLVVSGYLLYYAGGEALRQLASYVHLGFGVALSALVLVHIAARLAAQHDSPPARRGSIEPRRRIDRLARERPPRAVFR
jgi:hypothetical protein